MILTELQSRLDSLKGIKHELDSRIEENQGNLYVFKNRKINLIKAREFLEYISSIRQDKIINLFEKTITCGLNDLYDDSYGFKFDIKTRGNSSACDYMVKCNKLPVWTNIIMTRGKSVKEIISVILRIILIKLDKRSRNIVILDEPMSGVESDRQIEVCKFLTEICNNFGIQIIIVTHIEQLSDCANKEIKINGNE